MFATLDWLLSLFVSDYLIVRMLAWSGFTGFVLGFAQPFSQEIKTAIYKVKTNNY